MTEYFGKYRGKVQNNLDPNGMGRIQVSVPAILGDGRLSWAMPCAPYAGNGVGFFAIPPKGANIWVEFEGGDPDLPIWSGCFWGLGELPAEANTPGMNLFKTEEVTVKMMDAPGASGFIIETKAGMKFEIGPEGVVIDNGQGGTIELQGPKVAINKKPLEVA
jgi:uncharacterized protein involved in type VI secretion and phage assembly